MALTRIKKLFFILFLNLIPLISFAAQQRGPLSFAPPDTDVSVQLLSEIFGLVDGVLYGAGSQLLGEMFGIFNAAVLALAGFILLYTLFVSTLNTAQEGQMLGQKYNTIWVPIRSTISIALLLPKASGYCMVQIIVMWIVVQGAGAADRVWEGALDYMQRGGVLIAQVSTPSTSSSGTGKVRMSDKMDAASRILRTQVCMDSLRYGLEGLRKSVISQGYTDPGAVPDFTNEASFQIMNAQTDGTLAVELPPPTVRSPYNSLAGICGKLSWSEINVRKLQKAIKGDVNIAKSSRAVALLQMYTELSPLSSTITTNFFSDDPQPLGHKVGKQWASGLGPGVPPLLSGTELRNAALSYLAIMRPTLNALKRKVRSIKFIKDAKKQGWITAGAFFNNLVRVNRNFAKVSAPKGTITVQIGAIPSADELGPMMENIMPNSLKPLREQWATKIMKLNVPEEDFSDYLNSAVTVGKPTGQKGIGGFEFDASAILSKAPLIPPIPYVPKKGIFKVISDWMNVAIKFVNKFIINNINKIIRPVIAGLFTPLFILYDVFWSLLGGLFDSPGHPIDKMAQFGSYMMTISMMIATAGLFLAALGVSPVTFPIIAVIIFLCPLVIPLLVFLFGLGFMLAFYLPLLPYITFLFASVGWFFAVIEAMVAAPIVAIGLTHPEGGDAFGKAENGIMLLLNVFLRPSMMIIGFVAAIILSYVVIYLFNWTFMRASEGILANLSPLVLLFAPLVIIVIYFIIYFMLMQKVWVLIYQLPDQILRWLSGGMQTSFGSGAAAGAAEGLKAPISGMGKGMAGSASKMSIPGAPSASDASSIAGGEGGGGVQVAQAVAATTT